MKRAASAVAPFFLLVLITSGGRVHAEAAGDTANGKHHRLSDDLPITAGLGARMGVTLDSLRPRIERCQREAFRGIACSLRRSVKGPGSVIIEPTLLFSDDREQRLAGIEFEVDAKDLSSVVRALKRAYGATSSRARESDELPEPAPLYYRAEGRIEVCVTEFGFRYVNRSLLYRSRTSDQDLE